MIMKLPFRYVNHICEAEFTLSTKIKMNFQLASVYTCSTKLRVQFNCAQCASLSSSVIYVVRIVMDISTFPNFDLFTHCCSWMVVLSRPFLSWIEAILVASFIDFLSLAQGLWFVIVLFLLPLIGKYLNFSSSLSIWTPCFHPTYLLCDFKKWIERSKEAASLWSCVQLSTRKTCTRQSSWQLSSTFSRLNATFLVELNFQLHCLHVRFVTQPELKVEGWAQL